MKKIIIVFLSICIYSVCFSQYSKLQISSTRDINFSTILPGVSETITETNSNAGKFVLYYSGASNQTYVDVTFSLPQNISFGANRIPISFTATMSNNSNDGILGTPFDPYNGTSIVFTKSNRYFYSRLGGTINPPSSIQSGSYSSPIIITLTITSN